MNGTKSAKEYRKGERLEITEEKMTEETLEKIEEIFQEFLEGRNENSKKIADSVELYEKELEDFNRSMRAGITKESWFLEKLQDKAKGFSIDYFGNILLEMNQKLVEANRIMRELLFEPEEIDEIEIEEKKIINKRKPKWNSYNTKEVALELGREAKSQFLLWSQNDEWLKNSQFLENLAKSWFEQEINTNKNSELKNVIAEALKTAGKEQLLPYQFSRLSTEWLTRIACVSVEHLKIIWETAKGEMAMREATEEIEKCILVLYSSFDLKNVDFFCFYAPLLGRVTEDVLNRTTDKENKKKKEQKKYTKR